MFMVNGDESSILFVSDNGGIQLKKNSTYYGTYVSTSGQLELQSDVSLTGVLIGSGVDIKQNSLVFGSPATEAFVSTFVGVAQ